jgi:myo-inositol-1-phosphate synthase
VVIDMIRCAKLALESQMGGVLEAPCAYFCKHPPVQYNDDVAFKMVDEFIRSKSSASSGVKVLAAS